MKANKFLQAAILITILAIAASCRTSRTSRDYPTSKRYPYPEDRRVVVVTNDPNPGNLPPGQAKKIYGGRSAKPYAPGQRKKMYDYRERRVPLIIIRTPDIIISRNRDGRYYHRNADGFLYWQGYDNRFYIDKAYLNKIQYDEKEYKDWNNKGKNDREDKSKGHDHNDKEKQGGNGKGKGNNGREHH